MYKIEPKMLFETLSLGGENLNEVARQAGVAPNTLLRILRGEKIRFKTYVKVCRLCDIEPRIDDYEGKE